MGVFRKNGSGRVAALVVLMATSGCVSTENTGVGQIKIDDDLRTAAGKGDLAGTKSLIAQGANVNAQSEFGYTPLMLAAREGYPAIITVLLDAGARVNTTNRWGNTALIYTTGEEQILRLSIMGRSKAEIEKKKAVITREHEERVASAHPIIARKLLEKGADIGIRNGEGLTALMLAATNREAGVAEVLRKAGAKE